MSGNDVGAHPSMWTMSVHRGGWYSQRYQVRIKTIAGTASGRHTTTPIWACTPYLRSIWCILMQGNATPAHPSILTQVNCKWSKIITKCTVHTCTIASGSSGASTTAQISMQIVYLHYMWCGGMQREMAQAWWHDVHTRSFGGGILYWPIKYVTHPRNYCWHNGQARYCSDINVNSLFTLYFMCGYALSDCASVFFMMCLCGVQMVKIFYQGCTRVIIPSTSGARAAALIWV